MKGNVRAYYADYMYYLDIDGLPSDRADCAAFFGQGLARRVAVQLNSLKPGVRQLFPK